MPEKVSINDEDIIRILKTDIDKAKGIQDTLASDRETYYTAFRCTPYGNERKGWSQSIAPVIWTNHQSNISSLAEIFTGDFFILKSENQDRAVKFQKLIKYQMFRKQDGYRRLYDFFYNAGLYHYGVFKVYRKEEYDLRDEKYDRLTAQQMQQLSQQKNAKITKYKEVTIDPPVDPLTGTPKGQPMLFFDDVKVVYRDVTYEGATFEVVPNWEFFYSPDCKITEWGGIDGRLVFHQVKLTLNDIRRRERAGIYKKGTFDKCTTLGTSANAQGVDEMAVKTSVDGTVLYADTDSGRGTGTGEEIDLTKELVVKECYCKLDIDADGLLEPCIVVIIEDTVIAQVEENPYKRPCFRIGGMLPEPHKVNGIAPPAILDTDQKVMTNLLRFIQDTAAMSTYRNLVTNDQRMQQMLQNRKPFDVILGDASKLGEVPVQTADPFILKAWELMKGENEEKTGSSRYNQGQDSRSLNKTATGISLISQNSARRLRMSAQILGNGALQGVIRDFIFINQKWANEDPIKLLGEDLEINKEDLSGEIDIEIDIGVSPSERQSAANQMDTLVQFGTQAGIPLGLMTPVHLLKAEKKKYSLLNINVEDCMVTEQQLKKQLEEQAKQPKKPDLKEFVQLDKLYPFLTRKEQEQIIVQFGIQPDMEGRVAGLPDAKAMLDLQMHREKLQADAALKKEEHVDKVHDHLMDMRGKKKDHEHALEQIREQNKNKKESDE